jgi:hypothetical protein
MIGKQVLSTSAIYDFTHVRDVRVTRDPERLSRFHQYARVRASVLFKYGLRAFTGLSPNQHRGPT